MKTDMELRAELIGIEARRRWIRKQLRERKRKAHGEPKRKKGMGVRIGDRDEALKAARGYTDPSTYVRRDGSEKLAGEDWRNRKGEVGRRSNGLCERFSMLLKRHDPLCDGLAHDAHHVIKRSIRRDDRLFNLVGLSRACHKAEDNRVVRSGKVGA